MTKTLQQVANISLESDRIKVKLVEVSHLLSRFKQDLGFSALGFLGQSLGSQIAVEPSSGIKIALTKD